MRTTAIFNLKGGVAKTITTAAMADILAIDHKKRVLVIDARRPGQSEPVFRCGCPGGRQHIGPSARHP